MLMTAEQRAREFAEGAFGPFGVPSIEPYVEIIAELIRGAELHAFELGLERAAEFLADHALHEEDAACRQLCFDMAQEIAALKPPSDDAATPVRGPSAIEPTGFDEEAA